MCKAILLEQANWQVCTVSRANLRLAEAWYRLRGKIPLTTAENPMGLLGSVPSAEMIQIQPAQNCPGLSRNGAR